MITESMHGGFEEHKLHLLPARKYDPAAGADDGEGGIYSHLAELCSGDWSWKPARDEALGDKMVTFKGVPPSAAELYGRSSYSPA